MEPFPTLEEIMELQLCKKYQQSHVSGRRVALALRLSHQRGLDRNRQVMPAGEGSIMDYIRPKVVIPVTIGF